MMSALKNYLARIRSLVLRNQIDHNLSDEPNVIEPTNNGSGNTSRIPWIANLYWDVRESLRKWHRRPGAVILTVLTLAIGVGGNIAMYDLVSALMFRPPDGVRAADRVFYVRDAKNYIRYSDIRDQNESLDVAAYERQTLSFGTGARAETVCVECVTTSFFPVLGTRPVIGRIFMTDEDAERREPGAMLSYGLWQRNFGGDPGVLGRSVTIGGRSFSVIGIAPKGFRGVEQEAVDAWILLTVSPDICSFTGKSLLGSGGSSSWLSTIGRLRGRATLSQAEVEIQAQASPEVQFERALSRDKAPILMPIREYRRDHAAEKLALWLAGGALVLLVIACANISGLASIRAIERKRENAIRLQLGADRLRILAQHAAEYLLQALFSGVAAAVTAGWIATILQAHFAYRSNINLFDWRLFTAAFGFALLAGILSGMVPTLQASRPDATSLASSSRSRHDRKLFGKALIVLQIALALILVTGVGLFTRSVQNTRRGLGIDLDRVVIVTIKPDNMDRNNDQEARLVVERMADRIRQIPDVENVSLSTGSLLGADIGATLLSMVNVPNSEYEAIGYEINRVTPEYFSTLGTRIRSGRAFTDEDYAGSERVAIISETMSGIIWPEEPALGKCLSIMGQNCLRIVGISESRRSLANRRRAGGEIFTPYAQAGNTVVPRSIMIRTRRQAARAVSTIAVAVRSAAYNLPPSNINIQLSEDLAGAQARSWRIGQAIFSLFGAASLLLASLGLYTILAYSIRQRIPEIGIRMAVGATTWNIMLYVLRQGFLLVFVGWLLGIGAALLMTKYIENLLFQVRGVDTDSFIIASLIVLVAGIAGCLMPSIRAAQVNPILALHYE